MKRSAFAILICLVVSTLSNGQTARNQSKAPQLPEAEKNKIEGWRLASIGANDILVYYNKDRITQPSPYTKRVWIKTYRKQTPPQKYRYTVEQQEFNCREAESRIIHVVRYRQNGTVYQESGQQTPWSPIVPNTISDELFQIVCKNEQSLDDILEADAEESYAKGQTYEKAGDYEKALQFYKRALDDDPGNVTYKVAVSRAQSKRIKP